MTAHEEQRERVILFSPGLTKRRWHDRFDAEAFARNSIFAPTACHFAPQVIGEPTHRNVIQPATWILRNTIDWPLRGRSNHRFLNGILGSAKIMVSPRNGAEHLRGEIAKQVLDVRGAIRDLLRQASTVGALMISRTSMGM